MNPRLIRFAASMESGIASQSPVPRRSRTVRSLLVTLLMPHSMRVTTPTSQGNRGGRKGKGDGSSLPPAARIGTTGPLIESQRNGKSLKARSLDGGYEPGLTNSEGPAAPLQEPPA